MDGQKHDTAWDVFVHAMVLASLLGLSLSLVIRILAGAYD